MRANPTGRLISVVLTGCALCVPIGDIHAQGRMCSPPLWSASVALKTVTGQPIYVERPIPTPIRGGIALIGSPTLVWATSSILEDTTSREMVNVRGMTAFIGAVLGPDGAGRPIPQPPVTLPGTRIISPHVLPRGDSALEVYWATAPGKYSPGGLGGNELWHADYDGAQWSNPDRVAHVDAQPGLIYWNDGSEGVVRFARGAGVAAGASTARNGIVHTGIIYLRRQESTWRESWIETNTLPPLYLTLARNATDSPVIAFIGSTNDREHGAREGVFVVRSADGGATWGTPDLVRSIRGDTLARRPTIAVTADGALHLMWLEGIRPKPMSYIGHSVSRDGGLSWVPSVGLALPGGTDMLTAASLPDGGLIVAGRMPLTGSIELASWGAHGWSEITSPFAEPAMSIPTVSVVQNSLMLTWGVDRPHAIPAAPFIPAPELVYSLGATTCRGPN